ncbi:hypothetical protein SALB_00041 [Streptomyces noursei]|uniref:Uncharacterized protein n=1 Tax=Streptomyces noursei TaxID=1971 RepID=A0A401QPR3_STRNR|nr:hypothetical protein SALB_00041 [Streptomyces noursei]
MLACHVAWRRGRSRLLPRWSPCRRSLCARRRSLAEAVPLAQAAVVGRVVSGARRFLTRAVGLPPVPGTDVAVPEVGDGGCAGVAAVAGRPGLALPHCPTPPARPGEAPLEPAVHPPWTRQDGGGPRRRRPVCRPARSPAPEGSLTSPCRSRCGYPGPVQCHPHLAQYGSRMRRRCQGPVGRCPAVAWSFPTRPAPGPGSVSRLLAASWRGPPRTSPGRADPADVPRAPGPASPSPTPTPTPRQCGRQTHRLPAGPVRTQERSRAHGERTQRLPSRQDTVRQAGLRLPGRGHGCGHPYPAPLVYCRTC